MQYLQFIDSLVIFFLTQIAAIFVHEICFCMQVIILGLIYSRLQLCALLPRGYFETKGLFWNQGAILKTRGYFETNGLFWNQQAILKTRGCFENKGLFWNQGAIW